MMAMSRSEFRVMVSTTAAMMTLRFSVSIWRQFSAWYSAHTRRWTHGSGDVRVDLLLTP